jgi:hypothetical protein
MFRANKKHEQIKMFGFLNSLPDNMIREILDSEEYAFYELIFRNIDESSYRCLYSEIDSRPNAPVNCLVSALILKHKKNWSFVELCSAIKFNLLTKVALGLDDISDVPFDESTLFNFQNRLSAYDVYAGVNLMEQTFDQLTATQLKQLGLKTNIQRTDSIMASSNIRSYSRLQLLIEVLLRFWKILDESDKDLYTEIFSPYSNKTSGQYLYKIQPNSVLSEIEKIAEVYHFCKTNILPKYQDTEFAKIFERVYEDHFTIVESKIEVKDVKDLNSDCLQSPDDIDATFRKKRGINYRGQVINAVETASLENPLNLINDVAVATNNTDDAQILGERFDGIVKKTPDLEEMHSDGAYGNAENDEKFEKANIEQIQTAIRGKKSEVVFEISEDANKRLQVKCPLQVAVAEFSEDKYRAIFNKDICQSCQHAEHCPSRKRNNDRIHTFIYDDYLRNKRINKALNLPPELRKIRANVEATMKEFAIRMNNHKLKVRGAFKTKLFAFSTAIAINFGRIFRYLQPETV